MSAPVCAPNLFDSSNRDAYLAYSRRSTREVQTHSGRVIALGRFREAATGDIAPRTLLNLVEWVSKEAFNSYRDDPALAGPAPASH